jgi:phosphoserine phosphatase
MTRALAVTMDVDALLHRIAEATCALLSCERASVFLHDPITRELWTPVAIDSGVIRIPDTSGIAGAAFSQNQTILVKSTEDDPRFNQEVDRKSGYHTRNLLTAPMLDIDGKPIGVVQALNREGGTFEQSDIPLLQLLADHAGVAMQRHRLQRQALAAEAMRHEMEVARGLQQSMLPTKTPYVPGVSVAAWAATASLTGGDAYDFWTMPEGSMCIFLADAAGHGLPPAFVVSQTRAMLRALSEEFPAADPDLLLGQLNRRISVDFPADRFVTAFMCRISGSGVITWSSAGHGPVLLSTAQGHKFRELEPPHLPLGVGATWDARKPEALQLGPGALLVAPSDGMFEAFNRKGEAFGIERILEVVTAHRDEPVAELANHVRLAVQKWTDGQDATDDQTLVIVRWAPHS